MDTTQIQPSHPWIGKQIGNFKIIAVLGEGGVGIVFLAEHVILKTYVAIKTLKSGMMDDYQRKLVISGIVAFLRKI